MNFTADQLEKLRLLDKLFEALDINDLKTIVEKEEIVLKLKGKEVQKTPLLDFALGQQELQNRVAFLQSELNSVQYDMQMIVRLMLKPYDYNSQSDAQSLKSKYKI